MRKIIVGLVMGVLALLAGPGLWAAILYAAASAPSFSLLGPGRKVFTVTDPGSYTLNYNFHTVYEGHTYDLEENLPPDWGFHLTSPSGKEVTMQPAMEAVTTISRPAFEGEGDPAKPTSRKVCRFDLNETGDYELAVSGTGDPRPFTLRRDIDNPAAVIFSCCLGPFVSLGLGVAGLVFLILGVIEVARKPRGAAGGPEPGAHFPR